MVDSFISGSPCASKETFLHLSYKEHPRSLSGRKTMTDDGMLLKVTTILVRKALKKSYVHDAEGSDLFRPPKAVENHQECTKDPANLPFPTHVALAVDQAI